MKDKKFVKKPEYPGGSEALKQFVKENLRYPQEASLHRVEGKVFINYEVNDKGKVHSVKLKSGIGYGCDKEAIRIVKLLKYPSQINKGVRINTKFKIAIHFNLPKSKPIQINYVYTKTS
ncbi:MAG: energy transducer TonB [Flavobacteriales bacterium]|nr:energy transducer TonB [Flavobacteriales bacterium]